MKNSVLIKNSFYPKGLTESVIEEYWKSNKHIILKEIDKSQLLLWIAVDTNKLIVRRKIFNRPIVLDINNWDDYIHTRVVQISREIPETTNEVVIDIDSKQDVMEKDKKNVISHLIPWISMNNIFLKKETRVVNTSNSYNILTKLKYKLKKQDILKFIKESLNSYEPILKDKRIGIDDKKSIINIDFSPMYSRGSHVVPHSLNRNGTICMDITNQWETWNRKSSIL